jgi:hypothetical protein
MADAAGAAQLEGNEGRRLSAGDNLQDDSAAELWTKYMQLTELEAVIRTLKTGVSIEPLFHQLQARVKAHILVPFLGYVLWVTLKHLQRS